MEKGKKTLNSVASSALEFTTTMIKSFYLIKGH